MRQNRFSKFANDHAARLGAYVTPHGTFDTPNFMPVGTQASVKGVDHERLAECGTQITLVNTYHLWLRPGPERISGLGGIHTFCGWPGPILSDSGGFQVFSLKGIRKISEEGVEFRSHIDGSAKFLSPELSIQVQQQLGVDIAMAFDECPAGDLAKDEIEKSLALTVRWAKRSLAARTSDQMSLFGITQGGCDRQLRTRAAEEICSLPFDGFAIGGLSVGEKKSDMYDVLSYHVDQLPPDRIRYLMGVGTPQDLCEAVRRGVDLFDCVMPTRAGRFGRVFVSSGPPYLNIKNASFATQPGPLDEVCSCLACRKYSRAYIHHLFRVGEMLGPQLASIHNLTHYLTLMQKIRAAITEGRFEQLYLSETERWSSFESD
jgi:queuine tRNA-ribosyltransferase